MGTIGIMYFKYGVEWEVSDDEVQFREARRLSSCEDDPHTFAAMCLVYSPGISQGKTISR